VTQAQRVLDHLWSIAPNRATNGDLARSLGIRSHQTVYMLTQQLLHQGRIRGALSGTVWVFHAAEEPATTLGTGPVWTSDATPAAHFEARYGELASSVAFFFLYDDGTLERLAGPDR
jgi:hypothetical protein